jgi:hypothetical protein
MSQTMLASDPDAAFDAQMGEAPEGAERPDGQGKEMIRENPEPPNARAELVKRWAKTVERDRKHWDKQFKQMRDDIEWARAGADKAWTASQRYVANMIIRHVSVKTAALYARNPAVRVKRRERLMSSAWNGTIEQLQMASMSMGDPNSVAILMDAQRIHQRGQMLDALSRTLELVLEHQTSQVRPPFKKMMKHLVRRVIVQGAAYVKLGFVRQGEMAKSPNLLDATADFANIHATIDRISADMVDKETTTEDPDAEQLRLAMAGAQGQEFVVTHEGLTFDFPAGTAIIPDMNMVSLTGFSGCNHVTEEFMFTADRVKEYFGVDPGGMGEGVARYLANGTEAERNAVLGDDLTHCRYRVWSIYCKSDGLVYWVLEGWNDFLQEPAPPPIRLERFWPWFALTFNDVEDAENPYPPSDVTLLRDTQREYNRSRDGLRQHRIAARPRHLTPDAGLDDDDIANITNAPEHAVIRVKGMQPGQKTEDMIPPLKTAAIDPALYDTSIYMDDFLRASGSQEANMGGGSNGTATEASIAENSRISSIESNKDDLDMLLTELFGEAGQVALREMGVDQVARIVGEGAVWPDLSADDIADEIYATVLAGSSGKPNRQVELQNFERMMPLLIQVPGIQPTWLARQAIQRMDDDMDLSEAIAEGIPSISAMNAMIKPAAGPPGAGHSPPGDGKTPPEAQGGQGAQNAPQPGGAGGMQPPRAPGVGAGNVPMNGAPGGL